MSQREDLTEAERILDEVIAEQRKKGRSHYGKGLSWEDGLTTYDWQRMALEEAVDLSQYLVAENLRLQYRAEQLERTVSSFQREGREPMSFGDYQKEAMVTAPADDTLKTALAVRGLGLAGEVGEVVEHIKKFLGHGHALDVQKVEKELGDVLWYVATLAAALDVPMDRIARKNIDKLRARYPEGFTHEASRNRTA